MSLPVYLHSGMAGAPQLLAGTNNINPIFNACLVNGFNTQSVVSATASSGVVTFNFASAPGFDALATIAIDGASNAAVNGTRRVQSAASNQVLVAIPGVPDGAVGGTISIKFAPLGWTRPYTSANVNVYTTGGAAPHKRSVRVYDGPDANPRFFARGFETVTGADTGTGPFPSMSEVSGEGVEALSFYGVGPAPWVLVGTPRAFYFVSGYSGNYSVATPPVFYAAVRDMCCFFFGEYARPQLPGDVHAFGISRSYQFPTDGLYGSRDFTGAPDSRPVQTYLASPGGIGYNNLSGDCNYPDPASGNLVLLDAPFVREFGVGLVCARGFMPGMMVPLQRPHYTGTLPGAVFDNISGVTGRVVLMHGHILTGGEFVLLLDEDWGDA